MSKEAQRRALARKRQRNTQAAKWGIAVLMVMLVPLLLYLVLER